MSRNRRGSERVFVFVRSVFFSLDFFFSEKEKNPARQAGDRRLFRRFRFQQFTAPLVAKGVEDTAVSI